MNYAIRNKLFKIEDQILKGEKPDIDNEIKPYVIIDEKGNVLSVNWFKLKLDWAICLK